MVCICPAVYGVLLFVLLVSSPVWVAAAKRKSGDNDDYPYGRSLHRLLETSRALEIQKDLGYKHDPYWSEQWHINEEVFQYRGNVFQPSMKIAKAHLQGVKGEHVAIIIVGDARVNYFHNDFGDERFKWDAGGLSLDARKANKAEGFGAIDNDLPSAVAGVIGMSEKNRYCGVGIAPKCTLGGIVIDPSGASKRGYPETCISEVVKRNPAAVDLFVHVWQPKVKMNKHQMWDLIRLKNAGYANPLDQFYEKLPQVMGSGDAGVQGGTCQCNEYASLDSMFVFGSVGYDGFMADYSDSGAAIIAVTFSTTNGDEYYNNLVTIDAHSQMYSKYAPKFTTAISAAVGAGIIALLTDYFKRTFNKAAPSVADIAFLLAFSSENTYMRHKDSLWFTNGVGLNYSLQAGFGIPNMETIMEYIDSWSPLKAYEYKFAKSDRSIGFKCFDPKYQRPLKQNSGFYGSVLEFSYLRPLECQFTINNQYSSYFIQSMHIEFTADLRKRGSMSLYLISPSGTVSCIFEGRPHDNSPDGYARSMNMKSMQFIGEQLAGTWTLRGFYFKGEYDPDPSPQPYYHHMQSHVPQSMPPAVGAPPSSSSWPQSHLQAQSQPHPEQSAYLPAYYPLTEPHPGQRMYPQTAPQTQRRHWGENDYDGGYGESRRVPVVTVNHLGFKAVLVQSLPTSVKLKLRRKSAAAVNADFLLTKQWVDYRHFLLAHTNPQSEGLNPFVSPSEVADMKRFFTRKLIDQQRGRDAGGEGNDKRYEKSARVKRSEDSSSFGAEDGDEEGGTARGRTDYYGDEDEGDRRGGRKQPR